MSNGSLPSLSDTYGALLIGTFFGCILFGLTIRQGYLYFLNYAEDSKALKILVLWVLLLEMFTSVLSIHACYYFLVSSFSNPIALILNVWSLNLFPLASGVTMISAQSYFARRVWIIGVRYRIAVAVALALCMAELAFMAAATIESFINIAWVQFIPHTWLVPTGSSCAVVADFILTVVLVYVLRQSRTGIKCTDSMLDVMILYTVNTGLLTVVLNLGCLLLAFILPGALYYAGVGIPGNRTYAICLLAALNARKSLKERGRLTTTALFRPSESTGASLGRRPQACSRTLARQALSHPSVRFDNTGVELQHVSTTSCSVVDIKGAL